MEDVYEICVISVRTEGQRRVRRIALGEVRCEVPKLTIYNNVKIRSKWKRREVYTGSRE